MTKKKIIYPGWHKKLGYFLREKWWWIFLVLVFLIFWRIAIVRLDTDFGWHLVSGRMFLSQGFPRSDPFSYTMPNFYYVDHAWLSDVLIALVNDRFGFVSIAGVYAGLVVMTLAVLSKNTPKYLLPIPSLLLVAMYVARFGVRTQVIDWLFLAIFIQLLNQAQWSKRLALGLIFLIWLWANMHGGFVIGLGVWFGFNAICTWKSKKVNWQRWLALIIGLLATFLTPYTWHLWREVFMTAWGNNMRWAIIEWMPSFTNIELWFLYAGVLVFMLTIRYYKKLSWGISELAIAGFLWAQLSLRNVPIFAVLAFPVITQGMSMLTHEAKYSDLALSRLRIFRSILTTISAIFCVWVLGCVLLSLPKFSLDNSYPTKAITFLRNNQFSGNLFSEYSWGGYLIWKYPEKKTFVDGRMAIWRDDNSVPGNSKNAFDDYIKIVGDGEIQPYFRDFKVEVVLWPLSTQTASVSNEIKWFQSFLPFINTKPLDSSDKFISALVKEGWAKVYQDDVAVIYYKENK